MRYGLLADVHGNVQALAAVVRALTVEGVDGWLCAGDLVGYGARPNECVDAVRDLDAVVVAGNHDLAATGRLAAPRSSVAAMATHGWTATELRDDVVSYLSALPLVARAGPVLLAHGSLDDPEEYVRSPRRCQQLLDEVEAAAVPARFLVLGHTHLPRRYASGSGQVRGLGRPGRGARLTGAPSHLVNPGSVGQSRSLEWPPRARGAVLDSGASTVTPVSLTYDWEGAREDLRRRGLGDRALHSPPPVRRAVARRLRESGHLHR